MTKVHSNKRTNNEIGEYFGIRGPAVSGILKSVERKMMEDKALRKEIGILTERMKIEL
jgi:hypothetical protein